MTPLLDPNLGIKVYSAGCRCIRKLAKGVYEVWETEPSGMKRIYAQINIPENWIAAWNIAIDVCEGREGPYA